MQSCTRLKSNVNKVRAHRTGLNLRWAQSLHGTNTTCSNRKHHLISVLTKEKFSASLRRYAVYAYLGDIDLSRFCKKWSALFFSIFEMLILLLILDFMHSKKTMCSVRRHNMKKNSVKVRIRLKLEMKTYPIFLQIKTKIFVASRQRDFSSVRRSNLIFLTSI